MDYSFAVTKEGRELLTACMAAGKGLEITAVHIGSGKVPEGTKLANMTNLLEPVTEGTIANRRHVDNVLYLTVQYSSSQSPSLPTFYIGEFDVWAKHPITGENKAIIYATLGDYKQPVMEYSESRGPDVRQYPVAIVLSDEMEVSISCPAGLVTFDDLHDAVEKACKDMVDSLASGGIKKTMQVTIQPEDWVADPAPVNGYPFVCKVTDPDITQKQIPSVTLAEASLGVAKAAGVCNTATTFKGYVRLKSAERPTAAITMTCTLSERGGGNGSNYELVPATADTLGGIKASDSLKVDPDGTAHAEARISQDSFATDAEVEKIINDAFRDAAAPVSE